MIVGVNWYELEPSYRVGLYYGLAAAVFYAAVVSGIRQAARKGQAVSSPPQAVATSLLIKEDLPVLQLGDQFVLLIPTETEKPLSDTEAEAWNSSCGAA